MYTGVGSGGGGGRYVCAPPLSDPEFRPRHRAYTDICDVTLAWLASRVYSGADPGGGGAQGGLGPPPPKTPLTNMNLCG